ncbi:gallinacin-8-like isoform X3 [Falco naumanni]|uniref:gallinacin-8-like isoform X3 n=1 Tax=Falco rusticolus TaxID=120794 RepID=UPI000FFC535C|nr:gallinacin-8-like isoform X3 [Falco rusticolus]XP_040455390.1 gallinacin-8-like isoform X3 [Falco naumanni]
MKDPYGFKLAEDIPSLELLYLVALNLDMKIFSLFLAVLLLMLQGSSGFMRAPNNHVQCKQAGGTCSADHCPLPNTRFFGRCQQGVPCCRTVLVQTGHDE